MHLVRVCVLLFMGLLPCVGSADSYTFHQIKNGGFAINETHAESPYSACKDTVGAPFDGTLAKQVIGIRFDPTSATCRLYLDDKSQASIVATSAGSSCPDDIIYDFQRQQCVDGVTVETQHATLLALFLWTCLIGGFSIGFKVGQ